MKTLKAVVAKYNQTSLILRILIGLAVGSVLALVAPGAGWVGCPARLPNLRPAQVG